MTEETLRALVDEVALRLGPAASAAEVEQGVTARLASGSVAAPPVRDTTQVGLQISLHDAAGPRAATVRARAYDRIRRLASPLGDAVRSVGLDSGTLVIRTTPLSWLCESVPDVEVPSIARSVHEAVADSGVDRLEAVLATPFDRNGHGDRAMLARLAEVFAAAPSLFGHVAVAQPGGRLHVNALAAVVSALREHPSLHERLFVSVGLPDLLDLCTNRPAFAHVTLSIASRAGESADAIAVRCRQASDHLHDLAATLSERSGLPVHAGLVALELGSDDGDHRDLDLFLRRECPTYGGRLRNGHAAIGTMSVSGDLPASEAVSRLAAVTERAADTMSPGAYRIAFANHRQSASFSDR